MKIKHDFVTNSSSTSFLLKGKNIREILALYVLGYNKFLEYERSFDDEEDSEFSRDVYKKVIIWLNHNKNFDEDIKFPWGTCGVSFYHRDYNDKANKIIAVDMCEDLPDEKDFFKEFEKRIIKKKENDTFATKDLNKVNFVNLAKEIGVKVKK